MRDDRISPRAGGPELAAAEDGLQPNNFDLLRLLAAAQVLIIHAYDHFYPHEEYALRFLRQIPGVPMFFFISGFLISASWERNPVLRVFAVNRFLRIFPAFVAVTLFSLAGILLFAHLPLARDGGKLALWFVAQLAMLCDWNPDFLRHYGSGVVNGSLWTIPVEICFYAATPLIYWLIRKSGRETFALAAVLLISFVLECLNLTLFEGLAFKAMSLTPLPWLWMFVAGLLAQRHLKFLLPIVRGRALPFGLLLLASMTASSLWMWPPLFESGGRFMGVFNFAILALFILAAAYTRRDLATRLLRRNDISYGVYLFHLPIANMLLVNGVVGVRGLVLTCVLTAVVAPLSWYGIEKPALRLRPRALYRRDSAKNPVSIRGA